MENGGKGGERKGADIEERLLDFAVRIGKVIDSLPETRLGRHIAKSLVTAKTNQLRSKIS
ncbi:MAG: hypothetical protein KGQ51_15480 [Planctomycetes bacterium]|nr:hypothetical protein [Planctomycetota bacterium]